MAWIEPSRKGLARFEPGAPIPRGNRAAPSSWFRRSSASTRISGASQTGSRARATSRWLLGFLSMPSPSSRSATTPNRESAIWRSPARSTASRCCATSPAAIEVARQGGNVAVVGFCLGGTVAWGAAGQLSGLGAAVGYYGGGIIGLKDLKPKVPPLLHFGDKDEHIPIPGVKEVAAAHPDVEVHIYHADHGFNCDQRESYDAPSAKLAWTRTLEFLKKHVG